ncbi:LAMI_0E11760g1_1 [Lachancea mirantina]|uniref:Translation initiation factor eIF2 assembly protein n=1 Tax=Lachancea mirantina TaxID=1230905 RepID=A0A1G4JPQ9_9SACH|nr:LAMI_0E11760g1_1 [Lachancea mirantina]
MGPQYEELSELRVTVQQVKNCSFSAWYDRFKAHTAKAVIIKPLPHEFVQYLEQDSITLASQDKSPSSSYFVALDRNEDNEYSDWEDEQGTETGDNENKKDPMSLFPEVHQKIATVISEMGAVSPKLNWSSPQDASWMLPENSTKCREPNDLYLLLNASDYITHDLDAAFDGCIDKDGHNSVTDFELVLRQWLNINPALELRVFVRDGNIVGVSQRDLNYYDYLKPLSHTFEDLVDDFIEDIVLPNFPDKSFVCDVYIPRPFSKVWLIDMNPFSRTTDSLLFSWHELVIKDISDCEYELRLVTEHNIGRFATKEHSENQVPREVADAAIDSNAIRELTQKWSQLLKMQQDFSDDESDGEEC